MARILVVEDEPTIAALVAEWLGEVGHTVIGPAADIETALKELANEGADMALLDISLAGVPVGLQLAEMLEAQRIPLAFITGYAASLFPVGLREYGHILISEAVNGEPPMTWTCDGADAGIVATPEFAGAMRAQLREAIGSFLLRFLAVVGQELETLEDQPSTVH